MDPIHLRQLLLVCVSGWMCALSLPHLELKQKEELTGGSRFRDNDVTTPVIPVPVVRRVGAWTPIAHHVSNLSCIACKTMVRMLHDMSRQNQTEDAIINAAINLCIARRIEDPRVCQMVVPQYSVRHTD